MADQDEPKARYPKQEVSPGQKHGYIGDVEVYEPDHNEAGFSNAETEDSGSRSSSKGKSTRTKQSAADATPKEPEILGSTGTIGADV